MEDFTGIKLFRTKIIVLATIPSLPIIAPGINMLYLLNNPLNH
jgi:hypothetical protein